MWYVIWFFIGSFIVAFSLIALAIVGATLGRIRESESNEKISSAEIEQI